MIPKPKQLGPEYAAQFQDVAVVAAYQQRPPYPAALFEVLRGLIVDEPRVVLDVGCGPGTVARRLVEDVARVDAVDWSAPMIALGRTLPGGDDPRLRWIVGRVEEAALDPPYALIVAASSLHWLDWPVALPRLGRMLTPHGVLAFFGDGWLPTPWDERIAAARLFQRYSTNRDYRPYNLRAELAQRGLFTEHGTRRVGPEPWTLPVATYVESYHARNGLSRDRMTPAAAAAFDAELTAIVAPFAEDGQLTLQLVTTIVWGVPGTTAER